MPQLTRTNDSNASCIHDAVWATGFLACPCVNDFALAVPPVVGAAADGTSNGGFSPGVHLFPFRTESLSPGAPMVLPSSVGESVAANLTVTSPTPLRLRAVEGRWSFIAIPSKLG